MLRKFIKMVAGKGGRRAGRRPPSLAGLDGRADPATEAVSERLWHLRLLAMPLMVREAYMLRVVDCLSIEQIANRLAVPRREVIVHLAAAVAIIDDVAGSRAVR